MFVPTTQKVLLELSIHCHLTPESAVTEKKGVAVFHGKHSETQKQAR